MPRRAATLFRVNDRHKTLMKPKPPTKGQTARGVSAASEGVGTITLYWQLIPPRDLFSARWAVG